MELVAAHLGDRHDAGTLPGISVLPMGLEVAAQCAQLGLPLLQASALALPHVDVVFCQADEVSDRDGTLPFISGRAGLPDLELAQACRESGALLVVLAPADALSERLGGALPVLLAADTWEEVAETLDDAFLGDASLWRRSAVAEEMADPFGGEHPHEDEHGDTIVDLRFEDGLALDGAPASAAAVLEALEAVAGVAAHGLEAGGRAHCCVVPAEGAPRVLLPYLADADEAGRALARGT